MTEDKMVGWHHRLNGHEFEQALGDGEGQGSPDCCRPWGRRESDMSESLASSRGDEGWGMEQRSSVSLPLLSQLAPTPLSDPSSTLTFQRSLA